ncbi:MAG TPA: MaoC/PaaZ C-terminal domain-containing protein [Gaiellaceae bacterium]|nr:MaoC/PaaZ C-terminal domain-containing protein [Gaiellaceae bacterium]
MSEGVGAHGTGPTSPGFTMSAIGRSGEDFAYDVTEEAILAYADATDDVAGGPIFAIVPAWKTIAPASTSVASGDIRRYVVHYEQDMLLHRPIVPGMRLISRATPIALLPRPSGTSLVIKTETRTSDGELVNEQYVTEFFRGVEAAEQVGERAPEHRLEASGQPMAEVVYRVSDDQTVRYAAASGDDFAIHLDDTFARQVGLPGRIVHGLCTMAFAGRAVLEASGVDDPRNVGRVAVRFSAPLFPGDSLSTRVWNIDGHYGFEALNSDGKPVLKDGRLELR